MGQELLLLIQKEMLEEVRHLVTYCLLLVELVLLQVVARLAEFSPDWAGVLDAVAEALQKAAPQTDVAGVIRADLDRSGQFRALPERDLAGRPTRGSEVDYPAWRALRQDFLVVGRVVDAGDGGVGSTRVLH